MPFHGCTNGTPGLGYVGEAHVATNMAVTNWTVVCISKEQDFFNFLGKNLKQLHLNTRQKHLTIYGKANVLNFGELKTHYFHLL